MAGQRLFFGARFFRPMAEGLTKAGPEAAGRGQRRQDGVIL
jgi:hypothetical protein